MKRNTKINYVFALLIIILVFTENSCEEHERYYRPNLPEKLCCIGIIDIDDTTLRHISFEKSFQSEYPEEVNDSLREFSFVLSTSAGELFSYRSDSAIKTLKDFRIPDSVTFNSGDKYFLRAKEKGTPEISAEAVVPELSPVITYISMHYEDIRLSESKECPTGGDTNLVQLAVINITFNKNSDNKNFYALLLRGTGASYTSLPPWWTKFLFLDFSVRESNTPGFLAVMYGPKMRHWICKDSRLYWYESQVSAYFIDGDKITGNRCNLEIVIPYRDSYSIFDYIKSVNISLLSIPENLYDFEKSLYTYNQASEDPFTEPIYLEGNIKGGNGIFAVCRSSGITIELPRPPSIW